MATLANQKIRLIVTGKCNLDCFYCHNEGQAKEETFIRTASVEALSASLAAASIRADEVTISGGEPLLHHDLGRIVTLARTVANQVTMVSNGVLATPAGLRDLAKHGLRKIRLGVDSLDATKPRPSPGRLSAPFHVLGIVTAAQESGLLVDLNVVVTRFNRHQLGHLADFAVSHGLSIKFFEHVEVDEYGGQDRVGGMLARPHVSVEQFVDQVRARLGQEFQLVETDTFGPANLAAIVGGVEIRYCRYLCGYDLCWVTGTRVDPQGYVYNCMVNRGLDRLTEFTPVSILATLDRASNRPCRARARTSQL